MSRNLVSPPRGVSSSSSELPLSFPSILSSNTSFFFLLFFDFLLLFFEVSVVSDKSSSSLPLTSSNSSSARSFSASSLEERLFFLLLLLFFMRFLSEVLCGILITKQRVARPQSYPCPRFFARSQTRSRSLCLARTPRRAQTHASSLARSLSVSRRRRRLPRAWLEGVYRPHSLTELRIRSIESRNKLQYVRAPDIHRFGAAVLCPLTDSGPLV